MTKSQIDAIITPASGLIIFNTTSGCPNYYFDDAWYELCGNRIGMIKALNCNFSGNRDTLSQGFSVTGVNLIIPYTGGNGGKYNGQTIASTGVTGLTAALASGIFANGDGNLTYAITGTPSAVGTASFAINIGGQNCTLSILVRTPFTLSGGTETTDGAFKVLTFSSSGTLTVTRSGTIQILLVGGGRNGTDGVSGGAGGAGGVVNYISSHNVTSGTYNITIGNFGVSPGTTSALGYTAAGGLGASGGASASLGTRGNAGTNGTTNNITGTSYVYGSGGGSGANTGGSNLIGGNGGIGAGKGGDAYVGTTTTAGDYCDRNDITGRGTNYGSGGGGGGAWWNRGFNCGLGANGRAGVVIIRYKPN